MTVPGVYAWTTASGGVHFFREREPLRVAADNGVNTAYGHELSDEICRQYDTVLVHMLWDERNSEGWEKVAANGQHRMVFDIDDVMWAPDWEPFAKHYRPDVLERIRRNIELAHVVTCTTPVIAEWVAQINPNVWVVPNTVPHWVLDWIPKSSGLTVGYQGSPSHSVDWEPHIIKGVWGALRDNPQWIFHGYGWDPRQDGWPPSRVNHTPWQGSVEAYYRTLSMGIGVGPLKPTLFNSGKSSLRAVEYAALGIPCVLSSGPAYDGWVGADTGILVEPDGWYDALNHMMRLTPLERAAMGGAARARATKWTTETNIGRWLDAWNSI